VAVEDRPRLGVCADQVGQEEVGRDDGPDRIIGDHDDDLVVGRLRMALDQDHPDATSASCEHKD
jgi:hypothetical protein